jgi:hypothetical protein
VLLLVKRKAPPKRGKYILCTFEDHQNARAGRLTPHITPEMPTPAAISTLSGCHGLSM